MPLCAALEITFQSKMLPVHDLHVVFHLACFCLGAVIVFIAVSIHVEKINLL